jgi:MerR family transcriptional regulator, light-induced transcriptional regulator
MTETHYSMKAVARQTGLTPHVIRVWEKRYAAVRPERTASNRRRYSGAEVERLRLLRAVTRAGHSIGDVANLPNGRLAELRDEAAGSLPVEKAPSSRAEDFLSECVATITALNTRGLEEVLDRAVVALGQHGLLHRLVGPLAGTVGDLWREGVITAAHEHFASAVVRTFLGRNSRPFAGNGEMPLLVVATPAGQLHELGAVMVASAAHDVGWRVLYLGTSLPAAEIAGAAAQNRARAVALSLVYPEDDPHLPAELESLRRYLPEATTIIAGGRAAPAYGAVLNKIGAVRAKGLEELYTHLDALRRPAGGR